MQPALVGAETSPDKALEALSRGDKAAACQYIFARADHDEFFLGTCFQTGTGFAKDSRQAAEWFRKAMADGDMTAQAWLGGMMVEGDIEGGKAEGARLIREAAEHGEPLAEQLHAHQLYRDGRPTEQSIRWLKRSAAGGNHDAAYDLAKIHARQKNREEADAWRAKGDAMKGHRDEYPQMVRAYLSGNYERNDGETPREGYLRSREILMGKAPGTVEDAIRLTDRAARFGYHEAEAQMGYLYYHGTGLPKDLTEAVYWLRRAVLHGNEAAKTHLDQVLAEAAKGR